MNKKTDGRRLIKLRIICQEIRKIAHNFPKKKFHLNILINELILLNLQIEKILFDKNKRGKL